MPYNFDKAIENQRLNALGHANEIRRLRSNIKRDWRLRDEHEVATTVAMIVGNPPDWTKTWRINAVLRSIPHWGDVAVNRRLAQLGIPQETSLQALTPGWRLGLIELLAPQLLTTVQIEDDTTD